MRFSQLDIIERERDLLAVRKDITSAGIAGRLLNLIIDKRRKKYTFSFYVPENFYIRAVSFCEAVDYEIRRKFTVSDLAHALYIDFLEFYQKNFNLHDIHNLLKTRDTRPVMIRPYSTNVGEPGVILEEEQGFEIITTKIEHKLALRGELLLQDMSEIYKDHVYTLEHILEIVFCNFVDSYRKGILKDPIAKIKQYIV